MNGPDSFATIITNMAREIKHLRVALRQITELHPADITMDQDLPVRIARTALEGSKE